ncbi:aminoglycoside 3'-phosphotransferase [Mangrovihabitans endophyticus]|uniref:Putative phosphotransferase n=1 Tax=Mangrovihabitans endophyticus TaxID=1751298 RepID=A0A8J3FQU7_9ACTN|nr:aminoglycoside 3'-phosphotransferase [Mangrovihabitans endophyticus]GGL03916.1 putative phosphotransferase [Mangrovihabitans endophyticus]
MPVGIPEPELAMPDAVRTLTRGRPARAVWCNLLGGTTFEVGSGSERFFVKFAPAGSGLPLAREAARLRWARPYTPVPRVLDTGADETGTWLVTAALTGRSAVDPRWLGDPGPAVAAIGAGLRALHDALPVAGCPYTWMAEHRLSVAHRLAADRHYDDWDWHRDFAHLTIDEALVRAKEIPPVDRLVVCHGDACAPNTLVADDGAWTGHVDMAALGVADRWADLAVASWSLEWNYGPGWAPAFFHAYGVDPDPVRIGYYRLLWELGP